MRIGIYDPYLDTMSGGEKYMLSIAQCLQEKHEVSLLWDQTTKESILEKAKRRFDYDLSSFSFAPSPFKKDVGLLQRIGQTKSYDLIIYLSDGSIPVVGCPLILHFQSPMNWVNGKNVKNRLKMTRVKSAIVNSEFTKSFIDKTFGIKTQILYPPVALQRQYDPTKKTKTILNVGRFGINHAGSSFKKQDVLAAAFSQMVTQGLKGWELVFVMSVMDDDRENLEEFKKKFVDLPIRFLVNPINEKLWDEYESSSIYWHASGFGEDLDAYPDRAEHFGISTVEAMGVGSVPIVVKAGGQKEIVDDNKNGRLWSTVEELMEFTSEIINNKEKREKLANNASQSAERFSLNHFCQQVRSLVK